jgi:hypothetical protein
MQSDSKPLTWRAASKRSLLRLPSIVSFGGLIVAAINKLPNLACIFGCLLFATLPVGYFVTNRIFHGQPKPTVTRQMLACLALLVVALLLSPTFSVAHRFLDAEHDVTVTWTKRSLFDTIRQPFYSQDELVWGQTNYDLGYVPSTVFCPKYSTRRYPLFTVERDEDFLSVLTRWDGSSMEEPPPPDALQRVLSRCVTGGQAMLNSGLTKESALMQGNVDLFFARAEQEHSGAEGEVVLEDAQIPPYIMKKVETFLAKDPDRGFWYVNFSLPGAEPVARGVKPTAPGQPDVVRRLKTIAIAAALGRNEELARLKAK